MNTPTPWTPLIEEWMADHAEIAHANRISKMAYENLKPATDENGHPIVQSQYDKLAANLERCKAALRDVLCTQPTFSLARAKAEESARALLVELGE